MMFVSALKRKRASEWTNTQYGNSSILNTRLVDCGSFAIQRKSKHPQA